MVDAWPAPSIRPVSTPVRHESARSTSAAGYSSALEVSVPSASLPIRTSPTHTECAPFALQRALVVSRGLAGWVQEWSTNRRDSMSDLHLRSTDRTFQSQHRERWNLVEGSRTRSPPRDTTTCLKRALQPSVVCGGVDCVAAHCCTVTTFSQPRRSPQTQHSVPGRWSQCGANHNSLREGRTSITMYCAAGRCRCR